jgi:hypothetical protein
MIPQSNSLCILPAELGLRPSRPRGREYMNRGDAVKSADLCLGVNVNLGWRGLDGVQYHPDLQRVRHFVSHAVS